MWSLALCPYSQLFKGKFYHCLGVDTRNITNRPTARAAKLPLGPSAATIINLGQVSTRSA